MVGRHSHFHENWVDPAGVSSALKRNKYWDRISLAQGALPMKTQHFWGGWGGGLDRSGQCDIQAL